MIRQPVERNAFRVIAADTRMVLIEDGRHAYVIEINRDITVSRRADSALRVSEPNATGVIARAVLKAAALINNRHCGDE
jgi:hypothetical protein